MVDMTNESVYSRERVSRSCERVSRSCERVSRSCERSVAGGGRQVAGGGRQVAESYRLLRGLPRRPRLLAMAKFAWIAASRRVLLAAKDRSAQ